MDGSMSRTARRRWARATLRYAGDAKDFSFGISPKVRWRDCACAWDNCLGLRERNLIQWLGIINQMIRWIILLSFLGLTWWLHWCIQLVDIRLSPAESPKSVLRLKRVTRTRPRVPAVPGEILRNSLRGRPNQGAIRKTMLRCFSNQMPQHLGRDPVGGGRRRLAELIRIGPIPTRLSISDEISQNRRITEAGIRV